VIPERFFYRGSPDHAFLTEFLMFPLINIAPIAASVAALPIADIQFYLMGFTPYRVVVVITCISFDIVQFYFVLVFDKSLIRD
jgi:hypothetical protein